MDIVISISVVLVIFVFFMYASKSGQKMLDKQAERQKNAEPGEAKILESKKYLLSGRTGGSQYQSFIFKLEVSSRFKSPYITECVWEVQPMSVPSLQDGMKVNVKIDRDNENIIYPSIPNVEYSWHGERLRSKMKN